MLRIDGESLISTNSIQLKRKEIEAHRYRKSTEIKINFFPRGGRRRKRGAKGVRAELVCERKDKTTARNSQMEHSLRMDDDSKKPYPDVSSISEM